MSSSSEPIPAVLLLGPTGAGKTPLGALIEQRGLWGRPWRHFDFGAELRAVAAQVPPYDAFAPADVEFVRGVLSGGALLEDEQFPLAERILRSFLLRRGGGQETGLVLNGLPRHAGQAAAMEAVCDVSAVIELTCTAEDVVARIAGNVGGDRTGRDDDRPEAVRAKLALYAARTAPLVDFYRQRGREVIRLPIGPHTTPVEAWEMLAAQYGRHQVR
jgi:adenylate kinase family enzyme